MLGRVEAENLLQSAKEELALKDQVRIAPNKIFPLILALSDITIILYCRCTSKK
jgi:hypothetical protein